MHYTSISVSSHRAHEDFLHARARHEAVACDGDRTEVQSHGLFGTAVCRVARHRQRSDPRRERAGEHDYYARTCRGTTRWDFTARSEEEDVDIGTHRYSKVPSRMSRIAARSPEATRNGRANGLLHRGPRIRAAFQYHGRS